MNTPRVHHQALEDLVGKTWEEYETTLKRAYRKMDEDDLLVHVVVLAHGTDASRLDSTSAMLRMLCNNVQQSRVRVWLSYQGETLPQTLNAHTEEGVELIYQSSAAEDDNLGLPTTGKTENILRALKEIHQRNALPAKRQFVIFLDNDYLLYDAVNVHLLYLPWVMSAARDSLYIKAGSMRLKFTEATQRGEWLMANDRPVTFSELCKESLLKAGADAKILENMNSLIPTRDNLITALNPEAIKILESALEVTTQQGARSSRGLSCYLHSRRDIPVARYLSEFSFLLHGDQGTSLENWLGANLAPGYGLELSFLDSAMKRPDSKVINVIGLPHAHHPKNDAENFLLGIEMYRVVSALIDRSSLTATLPFDESWPYYSPTKLGFKRVTLRPPEMTEFYQPLGQTIERVAI